MKNIYKYNNYLYIALRIFIGLDIIYRCINDIGNLLMYSMLYLFMVINDHFRWRSLYKNIKKFYISFFLTMIISLIVAISIEGYIEVYFYIILYELILFTEGKISRIFISLEIVFFLALILSRIWLDIGLQGFWQEYILDMLMIFLGLFFYCLSLFAYKALRKEKREVDRLNKEVEELTIANERNRVAREIHDNLGHSLIALNMNLDVTEKILDKDINKARELIRKSQNLTKESMDNLRKVVYALKEENGRTLRDSIRKIIDNIQSTGEVEVSLNIDEKAEEILPKYKDVLYSSIKEALTNSMKHGKANKVNIQLIIDEHGVKLSISDNGLGCKGLTKGNGLLGIESRVSSFGGTVNYYLEDKEGFEMEIILHSTKLTLIKNAD